MKRTLALLFFAAFFSGLASAQTPPPIGSIDFFGLRSVTKEQVLEKLGLKVGDPVPDEKTVEAVAARLKTIDGVRDASLDFPCCDEKFGKTILYIGIREKGVSNLNFRRAPKGFVRLPAGILKLDNDFEKALMAAVVKGDVSEDDSEGHSLMVNPEARSVQLKFVDIARAEGPFLKRVIRESADAVHRALAVQVLAYFDDKAAIIPDLVYAMSDPAENVRNNATRALAVLGRYAQKNPDKRISIPYAPFIDLLNSIVWTDRNKSSLALFPLTTSRDAALLADLRKKALPSLLDIAGWQSPGHALSAVVILGRVAGLPETEIFDALRTGKKDALLERIKTALSAK